MVDEVRLGLGQVINLVVLMILLEQWRWVSHYLELSAKAQRQKVAQAAKAARQKRPGLAQRPVCVECQAEAEVPAPVEVSGPPPRWEKKDPRGAKQTIFSTWQFCNHPECVYFGWPKLNNLRANGTPNRGSGGDGRQWQCQACQKWVNERRFTFLYRRRLSLAQVGQVLQAVAEGLSYEAAGRIFKVEPDTVAAWVNQAAAHFGQLSAQFSHNLKLEQVQLDDLYVKLRPLTANQSQTRWLYNAIDPVSKFWIGFELGERGLATVQPLVHRLKQQLAPGLIPLFLTDGDPSLAGAVLAHFGQWGAVEREAGPPQRRWLPLPDLAYVQVVKRRLRRRLVSVTWQRVSGDWSAITTILAAHGWHINTAFIERFNLTLRQHVPGLHRQGLALARSDDSLRSQLALVQFYTNYCLPHTSLGTRRQPVTPAQALGLAQQVWRLEEALLMQVSPRL